MIDVTRETAINVSKAAKLLAMHVNSIKTLLRSRRLDGFKAGNHWRTSVEAVQRYVAGTSTEANGADGASTPAQARREAAVEHAEAMEYLKGQGVV